MDEQKMLKLQTWVKEAKRIVFFGRRGRVNGKRHSGFSRRGRALSSALCLSARNHHFPFVLSPSPDIFFDFYRHRMLYPNAKPNIVHMKLAQWEKEGRLLAVVTQNIDGLHQMAGSRNVYELHGSVHRNTCQRCGARYTLEEMLTLGDVPVCPKCGGRVKPDVVLYEEGLDPLTVSGALDAIRRADLLIVAGTSLTVYPAAGFLNEYPGNRLVLINKTETPRDDIADLALHEKLGDVFARL